MNRSSVQLAGALLEELKEHRSLQPLKRFGCGLLCEIRAGSADLTRRLRWSREAKCENPMFLQFPRRMCCKTAEPVLLSPLLLTYSVVT